MARASLQRGLFFRRRLSLFAFRLGIKWRNDGVLSLDKKGIAKRRRALFWRRAKGEERIAKGKDEYHNREHYCRTSERASGEDQRSHDGLQARADRIQGRYRGRHRYSSQEGRGHRRQEGDARHQ